MRSVKQEPPVSGGPERRPMKAQNVNAQKKIITAQKKRLGAYHTMLLAGRKEKHNG